MRYIECPEEVATHVKILPDQKSRSSLMNVTVGKVYEIKRNKEAGLNGEEMIVNDEGHSICSFSWVLKVEWLQPVLQLVR